MFIKDFLKVPEFRKPTQDQVWREAKKYPDFCKIWDEVNSKIDDIPIPSIFVKYWIVNLSWSSPHMSIYLNIQNINEIYWNCYVHNTDHTTEYGSGSSIDSLIPYLKLFNVSVIMGM